MERRLQGLTEQIGELHETGASQKLSRRSSSVSPGSRRSGRIGPRSTKALAGDLHAIQAKLDRIAEQGAEVGSRRSDEFAEDLYAIQAKLDLIAAQGADIGSRGSDALTEDLRAIQEKLDLIAMQGADADAIIRLQKQPRRSMDSSPTACAPTSCRICRNAWMHWERRSISLDANIAKGQLGPSNATLEAMIQRLVERLESAQQPEADDRSFEALEQQIGRIAERLESRDQARPISPP